MDPMSIIRERRARAEETQQKHIREVEAKIPEIADINRELQQMHRKLIQIITQKGNVTQEIEDIKNANLRAQRLIAENLQKNGYPADYLEIHYTCPLCHDTGYVPHGTEYCECYKQLKSEQSLTEFGNDMVQSCTFDTFRLDFYPETHCDATGKRIFPRQIMTRCFQYCKSYAEKFQPHSGSIFMFGETGRGKTHLSLAIANVVLKKGYDVCYDSMVNFMNRIDEEHFSAANSTETLTRMLACDLLILDDLGTEFDTKLSRATIYNIINTRMNHTLPVIISTNLGYDEITSHYEERITSRIFGTYECLKFVGDDNRVKIKQMKYHR